MMKMARKKMVRREPKKARREAKSDERKKVGIPMFDIATFYLANKDFFLLCVAVGLCIF
jgi:hypothetical protein